MSTQLEPDDFEAIPGPEGLEPFDPHEFATAFAWVTNVLNGDAKITKPSQRRLTIVQEDGNLERYRFADSVPALVFFALSERYTGVNRRKYYSAAFRILALFDLMKTGRLNAWLRPDAGQSGRTEIDSVLVEAAAAVRLGKRLQFPVGEFLRKVRELEAAREQGGRDG